MSLFHSVSWAAFSQAIRIFVQLSSVLAFSRLLAPQDYGLMAMAMVVTNLALLIRDLGTSSAVVQREVLEEEVKASVFGINLVLGVLVAIAVAVPAQATASYFNSPQLEPILSMLAICFPIGSSAALHQALLERESKFKTLARIEAVSSVSSLGLGISACLLGAGVYGMVIQSISVSFLSAIQLWWASAWRPRSWPTLQGIKGIINFSGSITGFNLIQYLSRNLDGVIIGKTFSAADLGIYSVAYKLMLFPVQSLSAVVVRAIYPALSRQQESVEAMAATYMAAVKLVGAIAFPLAVGVWAMRDELISVVLGAEWNSASVLVGWLAPSGLIQSIVATSGVLLMARGRTRTLLGLGILGAVLFSASFVAGSVFDLATMTAFYLVANLINGGVALSVSLSTIKRNIIWLGRILVPSIFSSFLMLITLWLCKYCFYEWKLGGVVILTVSMVIGISAYYFSIRYLFGERFAKNPKGTPLNG